MTRRTTLRSAFALALLLAPAVSHAVQPDEILPDHALEARARTISEQLRCLVCQNQSIDDSDAPLARDLRLLVRDRLKAGDSDDAVEAYIVRRYGEFVLLRPIMAWHTLLLWFGPAAALLAGIGGLVLARRRRPAAPQPLSAAEEARLNALLGEDGGSGQQPV
jgi:cytochrome c-type biogenesis protein CcmH